MPAGILEVDLEAALGGCRVLTTTRGYTSDYLGDAAGYWEPDSAGHGLRRAIGDSLERPHDRAAQQRHFRAELSWERVTRDLPQIYEELLQT